MIAMVKAGSGAEWFWICLLPPDTAVTLWVRGGGALQVLAECGSAAALLAARRPLAGCGAAAAADGSTAADACEL